MSSFVRFIFALIVSAAVIAISVVVLRNYFGKQQQDKALEAERVRITNRYTVSDEDRTLPVAHIAVESQELSGSMVIRTTILVKQYRFNVKKQPDPAKTRAAALRDDMEQREALPLKRLVIQGRSITVSGLYVNLNPGIPGYEFIGGKSVWCLADVLIGSDAKSTDKTYEKFYTLGKVPAVFLDEDKDPSLTETNLWYRIGEVVDAQQKGNAAVLKLHAAIDVRMLTMPKAISLNQRAAYRVDISPTDITVTPELQASVHGRILEEADEAAHK